MRDLKIYIAFLVGAGLGSGGVSSVTLGTEIGYSHTGEMGFKPAVVDSIGAYVQKTFPGLKWQSFGCERKVGIVDSVPGLVTQCDVRDLAGAGGSMILGPGVIAVIDPIIGAAVPDLVWRAIRCERISALVDGSPAEIGHCSVDGQGVASLVGSIPNGAIVHQVE